MRLDQYLVNHQMVASRSMATNFIKDSYVSVNGKVITKPSFEVSDQDQVNLERPHDIDLVSRGYLKIWPFIEDLNQYFPLKGKKCLDVGASTGGFTQVLLKYQPAEIYCIDVGHDQLNPEIKNNPNVKNFEGVNARNSLPFNEIFDLIVMDVSFISTRLILPNLRQYLVDNGHLLFLFKPQFEIGKNSYKNNIIPLELHPGLIEQMKLFLNEEKYILKNYSPAPISGKQGNQEYIFHIMKN